MVVELWKVNQMNEANRCPKCGAALTVEGGKKGKMKAVAKSLLTIRIETTYVLCLWLLRKSQTIIQK